MQPSCLPTCRAHAARFVDANAVAAPAVLLGSYFPGYIIGQIPSAMLANKIGGCATLTLANIGTIATMLATPFVAGSVNALAVVTTLLGLVGGSMFPVSGMLKRVWIPPSIPDGERAFALRVTTWGVNIGRFLTAVLTASLSERYGWRAVPGIYAAIVACFAVPFQLLAADTPAAWAKRARPAMSPTELEMLTAGVSDAPTKDSAPPRRSLADYKFLVSIASLCPTVLHTADNMTSYCLAYWAPTYFMEVFQLSSTATGAFLGSTHLISMAGCVIAPMAEILVRKLGASRKQMRRIIGGGGSVLQSACISGFVLMPSPALAAGVYALNNLFKCLTNDGGYYTSYIEVGGKDAGLLTAFGQTISNIPGMAITAGGAILRERSGSWKPIFYICGGFQLFAGLFFGSLAQVEPHDSNNAHGDRTQ